MKNIKELKIEYYENFDLTNYCTWKSGCKTDYIFYPKNINELKKILSIKKNYYILGNGSNTLFINLKDTIIISTKKLNNIDINGKFVIADSGATLSMVMNKCLDNNLIGFEFSTGIPGTIGGGLITNAGANGGTISDKLISIYMLKNDKEVEIPKEDIQFSYRTSSIKKNDVITKAKFLLTPGDPNVSRKKIKEYLKHRNKTQPVRWPSAGSVFKNPLPEHAGFIIEKLGIKGEKVGDAEVSDIHANYIINKKNAKPFEINKLVKKVRKRVLEKTGINLEYEVRIVDYDQD